MRAARSGLATLDERIAHSKATREVIGRAADAQKAWRSSTQFSQAMARAKGPLAVAGIAYDIAVLDRPWHEAAVSGGVGLGASIAAGAAFGTLIPLPIVGTALGAGVGAAAGIYASGVVDDLFDGGGMGAFRAGLDTLGHTGVLMMDAVESTRKLLF